MVSPEFPATPGQDAEWSVAARAVALPRRWLVVGRRDGAEVLRAWTAEVADRLDVSPAPDLDGPGVDDDVELQDTARWMVDFDTAERSGMAVRIPAAEVAGGLADGVDQLLVLGVDWDLTPADAAGSIRRLLTHHAYTDGMSAITPGTPTNVTSAGRPGRAPTDARLVAALDPERRPSADAVAGTAARPSLPRPRAAARDGRPAPSGARGGRPVAGDRDPAGRRAVGEHPRVVPQRRAPPGRPRQPEPAVAGPRPRAPVPGRPVPGGARLAAALRCAARGRRRLRARPDRTRRGRAARRPGQAADLLGAGDPERPPPRAHRRPRRRPRRPAPDHAAHGGRPVPHRPRAAHGELDRGPGPARRGAAVHQQHARGPSRRPAADAVERVRPPPGPPAAGPAPRRRPHAGPARRGRRAGPDERQLRPAQGQGGRGRHPPGGDGALRRRTRAASRGSGHHQRFPGRVGPARRAAGARRAALGRVRRDRGGRPGARGQRPGRHGRGGVAGGDPRRHRVADGTRVRHRPSGRRHLPTTWPRFGGCSTSSTA